MKLKYLRRVYASLFKWSPFAAPFTLASFILVGFQPVAATFVSVRLFDSAAGVLAGGASRDLYVYAFLFLGIELVMGLVRWGQAITNNAMVYEKGTALFRMALFEKAARLPLLAFEDAEVLNKRERAERAVNDETLSSLFAETGRVAGAVVTVAGVTAVLARYSLALLPLSLLSALPYAVARIIRGREFYWTKHAQAKKTRLRDYLWSLFSGRQAAQEMRVMGFDRYLLDKWRGVRDEVNEETWAVERKDALSLLLCDAFRIACYAAAVGIVLLLTLRGRLSLGVFGASITAFFGLQNGMKLILQDAGRLPERLAYAQDYYAFMDMNEAENGRVEFPGLREKIVLDNVSFRYPNTERDALDRVSLVINRGEKIAVLGENGSGKTTLSKVLLGLYPASSGRVLYDGAPVETLDRESLYRNVSAVAQDFTRYSLSLRENVALSDLSRLSDDAALHAALRGAGVEDSDLDAALGREFGGAELSGGQWQRLAIARGLFKQSSVIILDEPTSALDPLVETEILTRFIKAAAGKTALIISHRVGLCALVDRVIVMHAGRVVESGPHAALLARDGAYRRLYTAQERWYKAGA